MDFEFAVLEFPETKVAGIKIETDMKKCAKRLCCALGIIRPTGLWRAVCQQFHPGKAFYIWCLQNDR